MTFDGKNHTCNHCGRVIEKGGGYDWAGPVPAPGEEPQHFHISREFPQCRARAEIDEGLSVEDRIALALAEAFTAEDSSANLPQFRRDRGMMNYFAALGDSPGMKPVTPREATEVVMRVLREAGVVP